jgi:hypothetical protein
MTEDELMVLGARAANLLGSQDFLQFSAAFEQLCVADLVDTLPDQSAKREEHFAKLNGHRQFILFVKDFIDQAKKLDEKNNPKPTDDPDDPSVHNIY